MGSWTGLVMMQGGRSRVRKTFRFGAWVIDDGHLHVLDERNNRHLVWKKKHFFAKKSVFKPVKYKPLSELAYSLLPLRPCEQLKVTFPNGDWTSISFPTHQHYMVAEICTIIDAHHATSKGSTASVTSPPIALPPPGKRQRLTDSQEKKAKNGDEEQKEAPTPTNAKEKEVEKDQQPPSDHQRLPAKRRLVPRKSVALPTTSDKNSEAERKEAPTNAKEKEAASSSAPVNHRLKRLTKHLEEQRNGEFCLIGSGLDQPMIKTSEVVLAMVSRVLADMLEKDESDADNVTIVIPDFDHKTIFNMVKFSYTKTLEGDADIGQLFEMAIRYEMAELRTTCATLLKAQLTPTTAVKTLIMADRVQDEEMKKLATDVIVANMNTVENTVDWQLLNDKAQLCMHIFAEYRKTFH